MGFLRVERICRPVEDELDVSFRKSGQDIGYHRGVVLYVRIISDMHCPALTAGQNSAGQSDYDACENAFHGTQSSFEF